MPSNTDRSTTISPFTLAICEYIRAETQRKKIRQTQLGEVVGKSQGYVSDRLLSKKAWTTQDLDAIAKALGYANGWGLLSEIQGVHGN